MKVYVCCWEDCGKKFIARHYSKYCSDHKYLAIRANWHKYEKKDKFSITQKTL
jgi:hypothetical protein